jgi:hypothetical protein
VAQELQTVTIGKAEVDDREIRELGRDQPPGVAGALGFEQLVAVGGQVVGQEAPRWAMILDEQNCRASFHGSERPHGARNLPSLCNITFRHCRRAGFRNMITTPHVPPRELQLR